MPHKPKRPCRYPGCPGFCEQGQVFCKDHIMWSDDRLRGGADARGYDARWRKARALFLKQHPLCAFCQAEGKIVPATVVFSRRRFSTSAHCSSGWRFILSINLLFSISSITDCVLSLRQFHMVKIIPSFLTNVHRKYGSSISRIYCRTLIG